ncbi:MAG TPA: hypothetical protein DD435_11210 [Cyanobacteria bacterium UBA8530]|nr:hypothetical protein [Cyanobacteria bacterium UBA8530]
MKVFPLFLVALLAAAQPVCAASYIVQEGDGLGSIAQKQLHAFSRWQEIYELNRATIADPDHLKVGTEILLPGEKGKEKKSQKAEKSFTYTVSSGDTVSSLLSRFRIDEETFVRFNRLENLDSLSIGQKLFFPSSRERLRPRGEFKQAHRGLLGDIGRLIGRSLCRPLLGAVSSGFGFRGNHFHAGIDIPKSPGSAIHAAQDGVVIRSSWFSDYGKVVDIAHSDGLVTRYAHCSKLLVGIGERVSQGETIALVGSTGRASTPHLHFEVRLHDRPINPEKLR